MRLKDISKSEHELASPTPASWKVGAGFLASEIASGFLNFPLQPSGTMSSESNVVKQGRSVPA